MPQRTLYRLTNKFVEGKHEPGMYADGGSLYLRVAEGGSKQWVFRFATNGRLRDMGLGPVAPRGFSLAQAREKAREARLLRLEGIDPIDSKRARMAAHQAAAAKVMTFRQCAEGFIRDNEAEWRSSAHRQQWAFTLLRAQDGPS